jgi:hypothetical protein
MDQGRAVKKVFENKSEGSRIMGRPRLRWLKNVEKNVRNMKIKRWRQKEAGREEWTS